ncbi:MAG TPA: hypothetical protein VHT53_12090 [Candidatus Elarobacter sp.]|jgi:hypothetical protein|nr:hypothetical protein [Candidatus Elarobacter sp.]
MPDVALAYHRLHALAAQFDTVLQGHRTMLLTSQSVLLSVAAFVLQARSGGWFPWVPVTLFAMGGFMIALWVRVVIPGSLDVAYCQWQLLRLENGEAQGLGDTFYTDLVRWQCMPTREKAARLRADRLAQLLIRGNLARQLLNYGLPAAFTLCWLSLIAFAIVR